MTPDRIGAALAVARRHPILAAAFALAAAAALALLVSAVAGLVGWRARGHEPLAPWMTMGYVGRAHGVDPRLIDAAAGFPTPEEAGHALTVTEIAERQGVPVEEVMAEVERALAELRPEHGHDDRAAPREGPATGGRPADRAATAPGPSP